MNATEALASLRNHARELWDLDAPAEKCFEAIREERAELLAACKALRELLFQIAGGSLELAAKYGPDWEPPGAEHCHRVAHKADAAIKLADPEGK